MIEFTHDGQIINCLPNEDIVASNVPTMRNLLLRELEGEQSWTSMVFNCEKVETLDSIGINLIVGLYKKAKALDLEFKVVGCNESIIKVLSLFRLNEQFSVEAIKN